MKIEQVREVSAPIDEVWEFFDDMPRVATCLPGATLTNVVDDRTYEGTLGMKVGPISVNYAGTIVLDERDTETRTVRMTGRGKDGKGAGTAHAKIVTQLSSTSPDTTTMRVSSDVRLTGRIASLGRGVQDVAGKIFEEFTQRVSDELAARPAATEETGEAAAESADLGESAAPAPGEPRPRRNDIKVVPLLWSIVREKVTAWFARLRDTWAARRAGGR